MRKFLIFFMAVAMTLPLAASARKAAPVVPEVKPLVVIFGAPSSDKLSGDSDVISQNVMAQVAASGKVQMMTFNTGLPAIARAMMESRLPADVSSKVGDPKVAVQIAQMLSASYALRIMGSVMPDSEAGPSAKKVVINLEMVKVSGGKWSSRAESKIPQDVGIVDSIRLDVAASSCASTAVSGLLLQAFGSDASFLDSTPKPMPSSLDAAATNVQPERNIDDEYAQAMSQAERYLSARDAVNAIVELKAAINLKPTNVDPRQKLAGAYLGLGMTAAAQDECKRALLFNRDNAELHSLLAKLSISTKSLGDAAEQCKEIIRLEPKNSVVRMSLGDICWNQGKLDEAEAAYNDAASVAPASPAPHDKLHTLYIARRNYPQAIVELQKYKSLIPGYKGDIFTEVARDEFEQILGKLDSGESDYEKRKMSHEDYYAECKDLQTRIDAFDKYLSGIHVADASQDAYSHAVYAVSLVEQSNSSTITWLETEQQSYADQATLFRTEARTEFGLYTSSIPKKV